VPAELYPAARKLRAKIRFLFGDGAAETNSRPSSASLIKDLNAAGAADAGFALIYDLFESLSNDVSLIADRPSFPSPPRHR
jgi:hypothetical protein